MGLVADIRPIINIYTYYNGEIYAAQARKSHHFYDLVEEPGAEFHYSGKVSIKCYGRSPEEAFLIAINDLKLQKRNHERVVQRLTEDLNKAILQYKEWYPEASEPPEPPDPPSKDTAEFITAVNKKYEPPDPPSKDTAEFITAVNKKYEPPKEKIAKRKKKKRKTTLEAYKAKKGKNLKKLLDNKS